ncbi:class I SAM-dependent methyltransferase [Brevibacillus choshinensis]|nr:class I SAM-dependent methyltransferase [Brevibacillus choshinensis]
MDGNRADYYIEGIENSKFLLENMKGYFDLHANILEIGCNVGRNLNHLFQAGYQNVSGIEISNYATELLKKTYPDLAQKATIYNSPVEEIITTLPENGYDLVYTMAVLEHIHTESEWIFHEISRITKTYLITIEDEVATTLRHFPRNYKEVFEPLGFVQVYEEAERVKKIVGGTFVFRMFKKI